MYKRKLIVFYLFLCIWIAPCQNLICQNKNSVTLKEQLQFLEQKFKVNFSYNALYSNKFSFPKIIDCDELDECITLIEASISVKFNAQEGGNYMVLPVRLDLNFDVIDYENNTPIDLLIVKINNENENVIYPKKGVYTIKNLIPQDSIHIRSDYYKTLHFKVSDLVNLKESLQLRKRDVKLDQVLIRQYMTSGINAKLSNQVLQIDMQSLSLLAGETDGDILNILKNIPGIRTLGGKPGSLNIRGNTFDHNMILIDDIPIYHNGHFFGAISPYNPLVIDNIEVQRNTLSAKWGGRVGGLINMETGTKIPDTTSYNITVNTLYTGGAVKTRLLDDKIGLTIGARTNYRSIPSPKLEALSILNFQGSRIESIADEVNSTSNFKVGFNDINGKVVYKPSEKHQFSLSYINIQNQLDAEIKDQNNNQADFNFLDLDNWGANATWHGKLSDRVSAKLRFTRSALQISSESEGFEIDQRTSFEKYLNTINDSRLISEIIFKPNENTTIESGYTYTNHRLDYDEFLEEAVKNKDVNERANIHSLYISKQKEWDNWVTASLGIHTDYYMPTKQFYADPRILLNFSLNNRVFLKTSAGRSHQFIQKKLRDDFDDFNEDNQFWFLPNNEMTYALESYQFMVGGLYKKSGWLFDFEAYIKNTNNITEELDDTGTRGNLKSLGADFFLKKQWPKLETWLSYSLSKVNTDFNVVNPAFFDQRHVLNLTTLLHLNSWELALSWGYLSGMPVVIPETNGVFNIDIPYSKRFPSQHQLDFSTTYSFYNKSKSWQGVVGFSIINLYNQDNIVNIFQNTISENNFYRKTVGFAPNLQFSVKF